MLSTYDNLGQAGRSWRFRVHSDIYNTAVDDKPHSKTEKETMHSFLRKENTCLPSGVCSSPSACVVDCIIWKKTSKVIGPAPPQKKGHSQTRERLPYHLLPVTTSHVPWASTLDVWVRSELSVAKPFPQMLQWNGRFFMRSSCASWLRRCCCRFDSWMKARPQSGRWHL